MTRKTLDDIDLAASLRPGGRRKLGFAGAGLPGPEDDGAVIDAALKLGMAHKVSTEVAAPAPEPESPPARLLDFHILISPELDQYIGMEAVRRRATRQFVVLTALKAAGFPVRDDELVPDRRRNRKRRGA